MFFCQVQTARTLYAASLPATCYLHVLVGGVSEGPLAAMHRGDAAAILGIRRGVRTWRQDVTGEADADVDGDRRCAGAAPSSDRRHVRSGRVLTNTAAVHDKAWQEMFDALSRGAVRSVTGESFCRVPIRWGTTLRVMSHSKLRVDGVRPPARRMLRQHGADIACRVDPPNCWTRREGGEGRAVTERAEFPVSPGVCESAGSISIYWPGRSRYLRCPTATSGSAETSTRESHTAFQARTNSFYEVRLLPHAEPGYGYPESGQET